MNPSCGVWELNVTGAGDLATWWTKAAEKVPGVSSSSWSHLSPSRGGRFVGLSPSSCTRCPRSPWATAGPSVPPRPRRLPAALEERARHQEELRHFRVTLGTAQGDLPYIYLPGIVPSRDINSRFQCSASLLSPPRPSWQHNYQPQSIIFLIKMLCVKQSHK